MAYINWDVNEKAWGAIHIVVNLLETVKHNKYMSHRLQGVLYKIDQIYI